MKPENHLKNESNSFECLLEIIIYICIVEKNMFMLKSLYIKNYALIDNLEIEFDSGFSVITGETGAGKSIILGALSLILGQRADTKSIKSGEEKCIIEGVFDVRDYDLKAFCEQNDIEFDSESYIIRREILSSGKSRAFINDSPVSLTDLKALGEQLIDIHSQHENLLLGDTRFQMQVVDLLASTKDSLTLYKKTFGEFRTEEKKLKELIASIEKEKQDQDYLRFQFESLSEAKLVEGEQDELEQELETLNHSEEIKSALYKMFSILDSDESGVVSSLKESLQTAQGLTKIYSKAEDFVQRIESAYIDLKDLTPEIEHLANDIEFSPERLSFIESRLDVIYSLQQKYKVETVAQLIELRDEFGQKLQSLEMSDEDIEKQQKKVETLHAETLKLGQGLSKKRKDALPRIEKQLITTVSDLGMPNIRFECKVTEKDPDQTGLDNLEFLFSANKAGVLQPISGVASGGEISRVMLCLKAMIAGATALPSIIFDEIDTGVSGEIADKMGRIMSDFGGKMQVIAITHLPQIAAKGNAHYYVYKDHGEKETTSNIRKLSHDERVRELAQMLSGAKVTETAIENAKEMLALSKS